MANLINPKTRRLVATVFPTLTETRGEEFDGLAASLIQQHRETGNKKRSPNVAFAVMKNARRDRDAVEVECLTAFCYDVDVEPGNGTGMSEASAKDFKAKLAASGIASVYWSTYSHLSGPSALAKNPNNQHFRCVLFPDRTVTPEEYKTLYPIIGEMCFNGYYNKTEYAPERVWFLPHAPTDHISWMEGPVWQEGALLDIDTLLAHGARTEEEPFETNAEYLLSDYFDADGKVREGQRNTFLYNTFCKYYNSGLAGAEIALLMSSANLHYCDPPLDQSEIISLSKSILDGGNVGAVVERFNKRHATVVVGGKFVVIAEKDNPSPTESSYEFWNKEAFLGHYAGEKIAAGAYKKGPQKGETKIEGAASVWLSHPKRRNYRGILFDPRRPGNVDGYYNLWRGFPLKPVPGDWSLFDNHLLNVVAQGNRPIYNYLLDYMAHGVQKPWELPGVAIALRGGQGTGKGIVWNTYGKLFGPYFISLSSPKALVGDFNIHLANKILLFSDEAFFSGDKPSAAKLKSRITEPLQSYEPKGKDVLFLPNYARVVAASNEEWVVPAELDDRRWCVLDVSSKHAKDRDYFNPLFAQMSSSEGLSAFFHDLLSRDISSFNPSAYPKTDALRQNKESTMSPEISWWYEKLHTGTLNANSIEWPEKVSVADLTEDLRDYAKGQARHISVNGRTVATVLRKFCGGIESKTLRIANGLAGLDGVAPTHVVRGYELPDLRKARLLFEEATGGEAWSWPEVDVTE